MVGMNAPMSRNMNGPMSRNMNGPKLNMNGPKSNMNAPKKSMSFSELYESTSSFLFSWYGMILLVVCFILLFWIYYETIGYYFDIGWKKLQWSRDNGEKISIDTPGSEISAKLTPAHQSEQTGAPLESIEKAVKSLESDVASALGGGKEVFNVARNLYKFEDAEPLCRAFGAELATYDQVKEAHKEGADWCNYGWSKGQMALFPTQKETYEKLQQGPADQRDSCGVPGVNGGYFPNAEQRFGVNCYGNRPAKTALDERLQYQDSTTNAFDKEVNKFKAELDTIAVNPWAHGKWSS